MADGKRPGGLTALAVLNFVFAGLGLLAVLALFAVVGAVDHAASKLSTDENRAAVAEVARSAGLVYLLLAFALVRMVALLVSGIGYLGQKKFLGRTMGNVYAVLSLIATVIDIVTGGGFGIGTIIGLVYPVVTLALINGTFKDDLVN